MSTLQVGAHAPAFTLFDVEGHSHALEANVSPLTLAIFFKTTCPTCHYAWPFYKRMHEAYAEHGLRVLGISQHDAQRTRVYQDQYTATFPHLVDDGFAVSRAYDPQCVPTGFLIDPTGTIVQTLPSWASQRFNEFSDDVAKRLRVTAQTIVRPEDHAVQFKAG